MLRRNLVFGALVGAFFCVAPLSAQVRSAEGEVDVERAVSLEQEADRLSEDIEQFKAAAKRYRKAARLRAADDAMAVADLIKASRLFYYDRDLSAAYVTTVEAAERAAAIGDVVNAGHAFVDAAHIAIERRDREGAIRNLERGRLLTRSPHLTMTDRRQLAGRLGTFTTVTASEDAGTL